MAGIKCGRCGEEINHHGEPNGIELILFSAEIWKTVTESKYDPDNVKMHTEYRVPEPYWFKSDKIYDDFRGKFRYIWRCPKCGTLHVFDADHNVYVVKIWVPTKKPIEVDFSLGHTHVIYDDFTWSDVTELSLPNTEIESRFPPNYYAVVQEDRLMLFKDGRLTQIAGCFKEIEVPNQ